MKRQLWWKSLWVHKGICRAQRSSWHFSSRVANLSPDCCTVFDLAHCEMLGCAYRMFESKQRQLVWCTSAFMTIHLASKHLIPGLFLSSFKKMKWISPCPIPCAFSIAHDAAVHAKTAPTVCFNMSRRAKRSFVTSCLEIKAENKSFTNQADLRCQGLRNGHTRVRPCASPAGCWSGRSETLKHGKVLENPIFFVQWTIYLKWACWLFAVLTQQQKMGWSVSLFTGHSQTQVSGPPRSHFTSSTSTPCAALLSNLDGPRIWEQQQCQSGAIDWCNLSRDLLCAFLVLRSAFRLKSEQTSVVPMPQTEWIVYFSIVRSVELNATGAQQKWLRTSLQKQLLERDTHELGNDDQKDLLSRANSVGNQPPQWYKTFALPFSGQLWGVGEHNKRAAVKRLICAKLCPECATLWKALRQTVICGAWKVLITLGLSPSPMKCPTWISMTKKRTTLLFSSRKSVYPFITPPITSTIHLLRKQTSGILCGHFLALLCAPGK